MVGDIPLENRLVGPKPELTDSEKTYVHAGRIVKGLNYIGYFCTAVFAPIAAYAIAKDSGAAAALGMVTMFGTLGACLSPDGGDDF